MEGWSNFYGHCNKKSVKEKFITTRSLPIFVFNSNALKEVAEQYRKQYYKNAPFPHVIIDNFLPEEVAENLLAVFPPPNSPHWLDRSTEHQARKLGICVRG